MLMTNDVGNLFKYMTTLYGRKWTPGPDDIDHWRLALRKYNLDDITAASRKSLEAYPDFPPTLLEFVRLVEDSRPMLPPPGDGNPEENIELANRVYAYTKPLTARNPKGNPHGIELSERVATRQVGESAQQYEKRIANEITFTLYPNLRAQFENR